mgnify:CR=1 FL=1
MEAKVILSFIAGFIFGIIFLMAVLFILSVFIPME